jgi:hypothetical protein
MSMRVGCLDQEDEQVCVCIVAPILLLWGLDYLVATDLARRFLCKCN